MKNVFLTLFAFSVLLSPLVGCGSDAPSSVTKDADQEAIEEYRRMVAESQAKAGAEDE
ncbi:hypothetical protein SAMN06265222_10617 [Neorhodopirellula lusitana]|uniref:Secreted protein n=1 Tax=Neorhodopirellula lusitana TaxID=445327 RepID=A0ABY1Q483_9BACT|nr:hypothetical protein [Neorhodopirellula lusitana]SMP58203.1 hypothetical protein SAMN06265222_10617 [Neorhodopirellula lusitana]